ncbi:phage portal protein [Methyloversatilis sp.]|uniref:phage portal protein n=1 Tax=Methyloversatilis sp. TaxID=2569862 RepID=UPI002735932B|nr:phage portal protein [Methyloversatilis sp.]MDP3579157.1 phage portal protein [Methyloversatilis sp.]
MSENTTPAQPVPIEAFTFGDPVPVMDGREILDYLESANMGRWYETPISFEGLARSARSAPHHSSPMYVKRNALVSTFEPHSMLKREHFSRLALDFIIFGNTYVERANSRTGRALSLTPSPAKYTRRGVDLDTYFFVRGFRQEHEFARGSVFHMMEPDINQEVYGLPEYLSALNSAWLNEASTLFRRRYYLNGSHAGFILYMTDAAQNPDDIDKLREAMRQAKGPGNFRNLFMYAPNGKEKGLQIIPVGEVAAKDEFFNIKNVTRDDLLAAHRVPPQLMSIIPNNTGGFGDIRDAAEVFWINEIQPLQERFKELNEWVGEEVVRFKPYSLVAQPGAAMVP